MTYTLLLADDSVTIQRVIELTFAEEDIRVIAVGDGQGAIDRLESDPPDIVLADVDMPKRNGYEVAAYVKSRPKLAHIPVVLLTGAFEPIDQARADAAGSSDVLAKPFEPQMVINRVKQLLGKKRYEEAEVTAPESAVPTEPSPSLKAPSAPRPPARSSMAMNDEHATQQNQPARVTPGQTVQEPVSLDDYFDQLDAAFSNLQQPGSPAAQPDALQAHEDWIDSEPQDLQPAPFEPSLTSAPASPEWAVDPPVVLAPPPPPPPPPTQPPQPRPVAPPAVARPVPASAPVQPVAPATQRGSVFAARPAATATAPPSVPPGPVVAPPPVAFAPPPRPVPTAVPAPPARPAANPFAELSAAKAEAAARPAAPVITDEVIEEVVTRVMQRLSDRVIRETVTEIVSKTAERLVQEEILRIKTEGQ